MLYLDTEVDTMKQHAQYYKLSQFYFVSKKNTTKQRWSSLWLLLLFITIKTQAQYNLVSNGNFEKNVICNNLSTVPIPWYTPTSYLFQGGSYANSCAINSSANVPLNSVGYQFAHSGQGYGYILTVDYSYINSNRIYLQTKLKDSLINNHRYFTEFFISNADYLMYSSNNVSLLFAKTSKYVDTLVDPKGVINESPQIMNYGNPIITDTMNWVKVSGIYVAKGGEQYITIGNFKNDNQTNNQITNSGGVGFAAGYYIDDVSVIPLDSFCLKADAGRDTTIKVGDSVFIGSYTNGIDTIKWFNSSGQVVDSIRPGFWFTPTAAGTYMYVLQQTVNGCFSADTVWVNVTTLPLTIVNYKLLIVNDRQVLNEWTTANEVNVSHYNIERSVNGNDFTVVGKVKANNKQQNKYTFTDQPTPNTQHQTWFYRIAGVDFDGRKTYSTTKQITLKPQTPNNVSVFPNPAKDLVNVECKEAIKGVKVIDCWGREVSKLLVNGPTTYQLVTNNNQLAKGVYVVQVTTTTGKVFNEKLVVQ